MSSMFICLDRDPVENIKYTSYCSSTPCKELLNKHFMFLGPRLGCELYRQQSRNRCLNKFHNGEIFYKEI